MPELGSSGSVRGARGNPRSYRDISRWLNFKNQTRQRRQVAADQRAPLIWAEDEMCRVTEL
jgi:hypothetical protein